MYFHERNELPSKEMLPGITLRSVYLENIAVQYLDPSDLTMTVGGEQKLMGAGDIAVVPANIEHEAEVGDEPAFALDAWHPIREDYVLDK